MMPLRMPALAVIVLIGTGISGTGMQAHAQDQCLEFPHLPRDRDAVVRPRACDSYRRLTVAWGETLRFARDNRESCNIQEPALKQFEKRYDVLVKARDNVCAGLPRGFPTDRFRR
jgi:hypothetical protein